MALTKVTGQVINSTTDLSVGVATVGGGTSTGDLYVVGVSTFSGDVSVGGTLTYEDVTNVDAVGLITARNGISVTGGDVKVGSGITLSTDGDVFFTGIATGNGSGLTALNASNITSGTVPTARLGSGTASSSTFLRGDSTFATVTSTTINNNADNRIITGSGTANTLEAESTLTFDGNNLKVKANTEGNSATLQLIADEGDDAADNWRIMSAASDNALVFSSSESTERVRIDSSGRILAGVTASRSVGTATAHKLQVEAVDPTAGVTITRCNAGTTGPYLSFGKSRAGSLGDNTVVQANDTLGMIRFAGADGTDTQNVAASIQANVDGTPGTDDMPGRLIFSTTADGANTSTERMRIDKDGRLLLGATKTYSSATYYDDITINNSGAGSGAAGGCGVTLISHPSSWGAFMFGDSDDDDIGYTKYDHSNDALKFGTGSSDRVVINSEGLAFASDGSPATAGYGIRVKTSHDSGGNVAQFYNDNASNYGGLIIKAGVNDREVRLISAYGSSFMTFYTESSGGAQNEWMRIKQDGHVNFHTGGNSPGASQRGAQFEVNGTNTILQLSAGAVSSGNHIEFYNTNGQVGRIYSNNSATTYSTSSDYRLKENTVAISDGITRVKALKPYRFNWKSDASKTRIDGFFAHEVSPVVPEAIGGVKDAVEPEDNEDKKIKKGDIIPQSIDQSKLVPLLTAALQEAITKIETLETKVAALESA